ncbi:Apolipoprotein A1/A4/E domain protein [Caballeronia glebae]|uniref:Apolipoprotein A1/A4/E domain protein n=1 Tax=Caballeronia glebae TaxID=1777143 RepID=A0A158DMC6_9BURK|nr:anti-phage ZorAB system protein ZorA [Caballeronia glebae]SAK95633.1 Apolipoprotein A1/A4/E domain protein [Caballeronia glebae]
MYQTFVHAPVIAKLCALSILVLFGYFLFWFVPRAVIRGLALKRVIAGLARLKEGEDPGPLFAKNKDLAHLWSEYDETLFKQERFDSGERGYVFDKNRSTVPAEMFFNTQTTVDSYVGAEFFKHVPGILTGIGIIGTFFGILHGLDAFNVGADAAQVRDSLKGLLGSVSEAFAVSAGAILCAMIITLFEKLLLASLYKKSEALVIEIDKLYKAGAGEEMLQDLVQSSADYLSNSKTLKDALVNDLKAILESVASTQISEHKRIIDDQMTAQAASTRDLGLQIGQEISAGLQTALAEPMKAIGEAVKVVGGEREGAVHKLLSEVIKELNQSLRDLFGDQIAGINTMQQQTIAALQSAVDKIEHLSKTLTTAGTDATGKMGEQLAEAIKNMEASQTRMTTEMAQAVAEMKNLVANSQTATNEGMLAALERVSNNVEALVKQLTEKVETSQSATSEALTKALAEVTDRVGGLVTSLTADVTTSQTTTNDALTNALANVADRVGSLVSSLTTDVKTSQTSTNEALTKALSDVTERVSGLVSSLTSDVTTSQSATNEHLQKSVSDVSATVANLVQGLTQSVTSTQEESSKQLTQSVATVGDSVKSLVDDLKQQAEGADVAHEKRQQQFAAEAQAAAAGIKSAVDVLTAEVSRLVSGTGFAVDKMRESVDTMRRVTGDTVTQMNQGASTLHAASTEFGKAGTAVTGSLQQATQLTDKLAAAAGNVGAASETMQRVVNDYNARSGEFQSMLLHLKTIVELAEGSLSHDVLAQIQESNKALTVAQLKVDEFMNGVTDVLQDSSDKFQANLTDAMERAASKLVETTGRVTGLLNGLIENLAMALRPVVMDEEGA